MSDVVLNFVEKAKKWARGSRAMETDTLETQCNQTLIKMEH